MPTPTHRLGKTYSRTLFFVAACLLTLSPPALGDGHATEAPEKEAPEKNLLLDPSAQAVNQKAPDAYQARFDTTAGPFIVAVTRDWAPIGADRFYNLVNNGFFDDTTFFRVVPNFVVQFGLTGDPAVNAAWKNANINDEPVRQSNKRAFLTFAKSSAPNSRTSQLFINLKDNDFLDNMGFSAFGEVVNGMQNVERIYAGYGEKPQQHLIHAQGNEYLKPNFPELTRITRAYILPEQGEEQTQEDTKEETAAE